MFALWRRATICYIEVLKPQTIMLRLHMIHHRHSWQDFHCWDGGLLPAKAPSIKREEKKKPAAVPITPFLPYYAGGGELYIHTIHIS